MLAMPDANIQDHADGQLVLLTGTVAIPDDVAEAQRLHRRALSGSSRRATVKVCVINRLKSATPLQVMLKVRIAEVNRSLLKTMGVNLLSHETRRGGFTSASAAAIPGPITGQTGAPTFNIIATRQPTLAAFGNLLGLDLLGTLDIAANDGVATILAEPNLTALSGETASFLAGGEFPIPVSQGNNAVTIEYKQYGVGLAFTPIVLADGRISMRVRPEVSQLVRRRLR